MPKKKGKEAINVDALYSALSSLKEKNDQKNSYITVLTILQYQDPTSIHPAQFDAMLIKAANELFSEIDRDIILMYFGLLRGYQGKKSIDRRQKKFLRHSDYIQKIHSNNPEPYDKANSIKKKYYIKSLREAEDSRIKNLADFIVSKKKKGEFEQYLKDPGEYYDVARNTVVLPEPCFLKNTQKTIINIETRINILIALLTLITVTLELINTHYDKKAQRANQDALNNIEKLSSICFDNTEEYLPLDGDLHLTLNTIPHNAELNGLECKSSDPEIVEVKSASKTNLHLKAAKKLNDDQKRDVQIQAYISDNTSIKDEMTIHIIESGKNKDTGEGKLIDKTSGHFNQKIE